MSAILKPKSVPRHSAVEVSISQDPIEYTTAIKAMEDRVAAIHAGTAPEHLWLLEHPDLYTAGTSAQEADLLTPDRFPVHQTGRGGQYTYHGPGQRIGYVMMDLRQRGSDLRQYVHNLEEWLIQTLARFDIKGERREGRVGIWVADKNGSENKIAAIGVRVRKWVTFHGVALNVNPDLEKFSGIVPCGLTTHGVTSLKTQGVNVPITEVDTALVEEFTRIFG